MVIILLIVSGIVCMSNLDTTLQITVYSHNLRVAFSAKGFSVGGIINYPSNNLFHENNELTFRNICNRIDTLVSTNKYTKMTFYRIMDMDDHTRIVQEMIEEYVKEKYPEMLL
jgi:hypothetical protein